MHRFLIWLLLPFSLGVFVLYLLFKHLRSLRRAEVMVTPERINFGGGRVLDAHMVSHGNVVTKCSL